MKNGLIFLIFIALILILSSVRAATLTPINGDAETGDFTGWTIGSSGYGSVFSYTDPLTSASINTNSSLVSEGNYSFHLHDASSSNNESLVLATSNLATISTSNSYIISFDAKILGDQSAPKFYIKYFTTPIINPSDYSNEWTVSSYSLTGSSFYSTNLTNNGFTNYKIKPTFFFSPDTIPPSLFYIELQFDTTFHASRISDLYIDNVQVYAVPEPSIYSLFIPGMLLLMIAAAYLRRTPSQVLLP